MSFLLNKEPFKKLIDNAYSLMPGLSKCVAIYYSPNNKSLLALKNIHPSENLKYDELEINELLTKNIEKYRNEKSSFLWLRKNEIPFETNHDGIIDMDMFSELNANVLMVCIPNKFDNKKDLIFCYFSDNFGSFKMSDSSKPLTSDNKSIIGTIFSNTLKSILNIFYNEEDEISQFKNQTKEIISGISQQNTSLKQVLAEKDNDIIGYCNKILNSEFNNVVQFKLSSSLIEKLKNYKGNFDSIQPSIIKAAEFVVSLENNPTRKTLIIEDYHVNFSNITTIHKTEEVSESIYSARYAKTIKLLDKLEFAAHKVINEEKLLTSINVGQAFEQPISAPAISDALKKHKSKIITLLSNYPENWRLIRKEFRPLINLLSPSKNVVNEDKKIA